MYTIILGLDGKYHCEFRLQDSTERYTENTLENAITQAKRFAKTMNGVKIKKKDIRFYREESIVQSRCVPWTP